MRIIASALVLLLSLSVAPQPGARTRREEPDRGTVAMLRRDGLMIPFASFHGTRWTTPWPAGLGQMERPINLDSVPERWWGGWTPDAWQAHLTDGATRPLTPLALQLFRIYCAERIGLRTDYRPAQAPPFPPIDPYPKDGLAVTSGVPVAPIQSVSSKTAQWRSLAVRLLEDFDRVEDREAQAVSAAWSHPIEREQRHLQPVRLESWYITALDDGTAVSYIEAVRSYPPGPDDHGCGLETLFSGWVVERKNDGRRRTDLRARITYCDRVGATYMQPFGRVQLRGRVFWIGEVSGRESEWYTVAEISRDRVRYVAEYPAGDVRSCR